MCHELVDGGQPEGVQGEQGHFLFELQLGVGRQLGERQPHHRFGHLHGRLRRGDMGFGSGKKLLGPGVEGIGPGLGVRIVEREQ